MPPDDSLTAAIPPRAAMPLVVDLDGTLLKTDTLHEGFTALLIRDPWQAIRALCILLTRGRAAAKAAIAATDAADIENLPLREDFLDWLRQQSAQGRPLHLISAADHKIVGRVAARVGLFASHAGSDGAKNLKADAKAAYLTAAFPEGFGYAGDSAADLAVWRHARTIVLVGASASVRRRAEALGRPIEGRFDNVPSWSPVLRQLRLHQWTKNLLVFMPMLLAHRFQAPEDWAATGLAFLGLGCAASATYIMNDLADLSADRAHRTKCNRPLASGALPLLQGFLLMPALMVAGFVLAFEASALAALTLLVYVVLTLSYSLRFKRVPLLDTALLGLLFTLRLLIGCAALKIPPSFWLLAFSITLFFSLSVAKRQTEIVKKAAEGVTDTIGGRGYRVSDEPLTLAYGISTSVASLIILILYTTNDVAHALYRNPDWLWAVPLLLHFWMLRIWLLAHRGELHDDPIVFALKDRISLVIGLGCAIAFCLAI